VIGREELERSTDVFSIEMIEIQAQYRILYGEDVIKNLHVPMRLHRAQLEYELREKVILLREKLCKHGADELVIDLVHLHPLDEQAARIQVAAGEVICDSLSFADLDFLVLGVRHIRVSRFALCGLITFSIRTAHVQVLVQT